MGVRGAGLKSLPDVGDDGRDLGRRQHVFPGRHRGIGNAVQDSLLHGVVILKEPEFRVGEVARTRLEKAADPVATGAVGRMAERAVFLIQAAASERGLRESFRVRRNVVIAYGEAPETRSLDACRWLKCRRG